MPGQTHQPEEPTHQIEAIASQLEGATPPAPGSRGWGGARPGAGRKSKPEGRKVLTRLHLPRELVALLDERAAREGVSRSEAAGRCLKEWGDRR